VKSLTIKQLDALGRFYNRLAETLDVEWRLEVLHLDINKDGPAITVRLWVPLAEHFQSRDGVIERAFADATIPGYDHSGFGFQPTPVAGCRVRDHDFHPEAT
jgi:hypothetical protein